MFGLFNSFKKSFSGNTLSSLDNYRLTLGIELFKERGAAVLGRLHRYQKKRNIPIDDDSNPSVQASNNLSDLVNTKVYCISSFDELKKFNQQLDNVEKSFLKS